jgi:hypothetical protein
MMKDAPCREVILELAQEYDPVTPEAMQEAWRAPAPRGYFRCACARAKADIARRAALIDARPRKPPRTRRPSAA